MIKWLSKLICHFKGHTSLQRGQEYTGIYQEIKGYGAFGRGFPYVYKGRLYHCSRCDELCICRGVTFWELEDLISGTLKNLPQNFSDTWCSWNYDMCRIYK